MDTLEIYFNDREQLEIFVKWFQEKGFQHLLDECPNDFECIESVNVPAEDEIDDDAFIEIC